MKGVTATSSPNKKAKKVQKWLKEKEQLAVFPSQLNLSDIEVIVPSAPVQPVPSQPDAINDEIFAPSAPVQSVFISVPVQLISSQLDPIDDRIGALSAPVGQPSDYIRTCKAICMQSVFISVPVQLVGNQLDPVNDQDPSMMRSLHCMLQFS